MIRRASIRLRLLLLALMPATLIAASLSLYFVLTGMQALDAELRTRGQEIVRYLAPASEYGVFSGNRMLLQSLAQATLQQADVLAVTITDSAGRVQALSGRTRLSSPHLSMSLGGPTLLAEQPGWLLFAAPIWRSRAETDDLLSQNLDDASLAPEADTPVGQVYIELSTDSVDARKSTLILTSLTILLAGLLLTAALALRMGRGVARPVARLARAVGYMAAGDLGVRVKNESKGELGELEQGFNRMAERLQDAHQTMQQRIDEATAALAHQASHDPLTGLINRREFEKRLERAIGHAHEHGSNHVLCYLDLDQFKIVNDSCGHPAGDALLRQLTALLRGRVRAEDTLARLGGDEFGVLLENCRLEDALRVVETLRQVVNNFRFIWEERQFAVGVSIGVTIINAQTESLAEVMSAADIACYAAKEGGRNRIEVFQPDTQAVAQRQRDGSWEERIRRALDENRILLFAQGVHTLDPAAKTLPCCELFVRLQAEDGSIVLPGAFLPAAERANLLSTLEYWLIDRACATLAQHLRQAGCERFVCSINISGPTLARSDCIEQIEHSLNRYGLPASHLCFEVAEASIGRNPAAVEAFIEPLRAIGCRIALDDFGSGVSAFQLLRQLRPDIVKIDSALCSELADSELSRTLVRAIQQVAQQLGIVTVAESVDSPATLAVLRQLGIDCAQGFELGRPIRFETWLASEFANCGEHGCSQRGHASTAAPLPPSLSPH